MNVMGGMFKDEKKWGNCRKQFVFNVGSYAHFWSFRVDSSVNVDSIESAIEKLQWITREKELEVEVQKSGHKWKQEEEVVDKNKSRRRVEKNRERSIEYSTIHCKVIVAFIIIFKMCIREGIYWEDTIFINNNSKHRYNYNFYSWVFEQK